MEPHPSDAAELFISYAREDEKLCSQLIKHLSGLKREGVIRGWYDRDISAGSEWNETIINQLRKSAAVLLLVSPDFMESEYVHGVEVREAMEMHESGAALVIPVILHPADWEGSPFGKLQALPADGRPVASWRNRNKAFLEVVQGIRKAVGEAPRPSPPCKGAPLIPRAPAVGFVQRRDRGHDLVRHLVEELAPGKPRSIMLSGLEGVGKTKLAAEVARELEAGSQICVVWSDGGKRVDYTFQSLLDDVATQLGHSDLRLLPSQAKEERVRALAAGRPVLVVIDNHEAVAAEEAERIDEFFKHVRCSVLYVSLRRKEDDKATDVTGIKLPPMGVDESDELIRRLIEWAENPEVYSDRIRRRIHSVTEGRPALIEWVVQQIDAGDEGAEEVCRKVARGEGDVIQRVFDASFELLKKDGRATLLALSLFPSSATRETLRAVVGLKEQRLKEAIWDLRTLMLIEMETQAEPLRFKIKGITRKLAERLLSADRRASAKYWLNFIRHYMARVDEFVRVRRGPLDVPLAERSNLLRAMQLASYAGNWDTVLELYVKTKKYIPASAFCVWRQAVDLAESEAEETLGDDKSLTPPIIIEIKHEEIGKAQESYQKLKRKSRKKGEKMLERFARDPSLVLKKSEILVAIELSIIEFELGVFAYREGRHADAQEHYERAKGYKELTKDWRGFATVCNNLGAAIAREKQKGWAERAGAALNLSVKKFKELDSNFQKVAGGNLKWLKGEARRNSLPGRRHSSRMRP
jgi:tetratricopeptide (TPR) repeat protein